MGAAAALWFAAVLLQGTQDRATLAALGRGHSTACLFSAPRTGRPLLKHMPAVRPAACLNLRGGSDSAAQCGKPRPVLESGVPANGNHREKKPRHERASRRRKRRSDHHTSPDALFETGVRALPTNAPARESLDERRRRELGRCISGWMYWRLNPSAFRSFLYDVLQIYVGVRQPCAPSLEFSFMFFHSLADVLAREDSDGLRIGTDASLSAYSQTKIHRNRNRMCAYAFHDAGYAFSFAHDSLQKTRSVCNGTSATLPLQTMPCRRARILSKSTCGIYTVCVCARMCVRARAHLFKFPCTSMHMVSRLTHVRR